MAASSTPLPTKERHKSPPRHLLMAFEHEKIKSECPRSSINSLSYSIGLQPSLAAVVIRMTAVLPVGQNLYIYRRPGRVRDGNYDYQLQHREWDEGVSDLRGWVGGNRFSAWRPIGKWRQPLPYSLFAMSAGTAYSHQWTRQPSRAESYII